MEVVTGLIILVVLGIVVSIIMPSKKPTKKSIDFDDTLETSIEEIEPVNTGHHKMLRIALGHRAIEPKEEIEELSLKDLVRESTLTYRIRGPRRRRVAVRQPVIRGTTTRLSIFA